MRVIFYSAAKNAYAPALVIRFLDTSKFVKVLSWFIIQSIIASAPIFVILFLRRFRFTIIYRSFKKSHSSITCLSVSY